jgi:hypothetical protein
MHAIIVTFRRDLPDDAYAALCHDFADGAAAIAGLAAKAFVEDGEKSGGIYFFTDEQAASAYLDGPIVRAIRAQPVITDFAVARYDVDERVSARTGFGALLGAAR